MLDTMTARVTVSPGPLSVFDADGSAFIIHDAEDTYCPEGVAQGCAGGSRAAFVASSGRFRKRLEDPHSSSLALVRVSAPARGFETVWAGALRDVQVRKVIRASEGRQPDGLPVGH